jgi:hypothetical protein
LTTAQRYKVEFNDEKEVFDLVKNLSLDDPIHPGGHPFKMMENRREYIVFQNYSRFSRCLNDYQSALDHDTYEAWTCLKAGSRFDDSIDQLERDEMGRLKWAWKVATSPIGEREQTQLIKAGFMKPEERWFRLKSAATDEDVKIHAGAIQWNDYRKRWVFITSEIFGSSLLGEVWYAEADSPLGPWGYAAKIITHEKYSFYNPVQHPHFAKDGGREIFFEGTYTKAFSGNEVGTPRYDYNQIMYKIDLDDPRLALPIPIYESKGVFPQFTTGAGIWSPEKNEPDLKKREIAFYACDQLGEGMIPIYEIRDDELGSKLTALAPGSPSLPNVNISFYALPADDKTTSAPIVMLYEYIGDENGKRIYLPQKNTPPAGFTRAEQPLCCVWKKPVEYNPFFNFDIEY